uniref:Armadillo repeat-containing protein 8 n=2 Tax=Corethron hystrix TaxID=216773 RepID=A0A7S1FNB9_9STRA|mmetsp:Transcript_18060/g.41081  ORF Transcript_18060/g.41081 Transcript_18060/m.41081 type:complete len:525 (+) Transcript_18060:739-2313(+)
MEYDELYNILNHENEKQHDREIEAGIATVLCRLLRTILKLPTNCSAFEKDVSKVCLCLELVYRCSNKKRIQSFEAIGIEICPLLVEVSDKCFDGTFTFMPEFVLKRVIKIFAYFALLRPIQSAMSANTAMMDNLVKTLNIPEYHTARIDALWAISNIAYTDTNRERLVMHHRLLNSVIFCALEGNSEIKEESAAVLMNITAAKSCHETFAFHGRYLEALRELLLIEGNSRNRAAGALRFLASSQEAHMRIIYYNNGCIISTLQTVLLEDHNEKVCVRAIGTIRNLVRNGTSEALARHDTLLTMLTEVVSTSKFPKVQEIGLSIFKEFCERINHPSPSHDALLRSLVNTRYREEEETNNSKHDLYKSESIVLQTYKQENLIPMIQCIGMLDAIVSLANSKEPKARENISIAMKMLVCDPSKKTMLANEKIFLDAITLLLDSAGAGQRNAIQTIMLLASIEKNREVLMAHTGLVEKVVQISRSINDEDLRSSAVKCVTILMRVMVPSKKYGLEGLRIEKFKRLPIT